MDIDACIVSSMLKVNLLVISDDVLLGNSSRKPEFEQQHKQLQDDLERLVIDSDNVGHSMKRLEMILPQLDHLVNRQATQISEIHDSLNREFAVMDVAFQLILVKEPIAKNSCGGCQQYHTERITPQWEQGSYPILGSC